jgi:histidyl-tRNA synthetase
MPLVATAPRGTSDLLPANSHEMRQIEKVFYKTAELFGFSEIRTPVFEHTALFQRGVGNTTDVVQKEMYTFEDKGGRSVTLKPEGTAGAARAFLEHGLFNEALPQKVWYLTSCYRYEKPQAGRLREFHQFGVEIFGAAEPTADAELIAFAALCFEKLGIKNLLLQINSIGCPVCRKNYQNALKAYFESNINNLCETCKERIHRNPMRILDCKNPACQEIAKNAPVILDYLCGKCSAHFEKTKTLLLAYGIDFEVNPHIVRGLDYYTRTVFEFISSEIGAQGTVCGGGRYDGLTAELGGQAIPSLGFAAGLERLMLLAKAQNICLSEKPKCKLDIAALGEKASVFAAQLALKLRRENIFVLSDLSGRGLKAQMKYADKISAENVAVIGESELESGLVNLKNMQTGETLQVEISKIEAALAPIA